MKTYENIQLFLDEYTQQKSNEQGFRDSQLVKAIHTTDQNYRQQTLEGKDVLGFQPLLLKFADPFTMKTSQVLVKDVNDAVAHELKAFFRKQYVGDFAKRFGGFSPDVFDAFTEYDSWEAFDKSWLTRDGGSVMHINLPLLFDHLSDVEHWTRKQTGQKVLSYKRLLVTTYFIPENKFFTFFIKDVNDTELDRIKMLVHGRLELSNERLFAE